MRKVHSALFACLWAVWALHAQGAPEPSPTTVVLVRHAEKALHITQDPPLTNAGQRRAQALADMLADARVAAGVSAVFASPYARTQQTAQPLAARAGVDVTAYDPGDSAALAARVLDQYAGDTVVIVGHSNTLPGLAAAFGAPTPLPPIAHDEYDNLYVLTVPPGTARPVGVVRLHMTTPAPPAPPSLSSLAATQAWHLAREHFVDGDAVGGQRWDDAYAHHLAALPREANATQASAAINAMLSGLRTSHTSHYTPDDAAWYQLLGIFTHLFPDLRARRFAASDAKVTYTGLPIEIRYLEGRPFVGGFFKPQEETPLLLGDELLAVDGVPFDEITPFRGKAGQPVALTVRRERDGPPLTVTVTPQRLEAQTMFIDAIAHGTEIHPGADDAVIASMNIVCASRRCGVTVT
ncbi:MAG: histidine phosphatase family protein, partial [Pseudomonadota bacterium]